MIKALALIFAFILLLTVSVYWSRPIHADEGLAVPDAQKYHLQAIDARIGVLQVQYSSLKAERDAVEAEIWKLSKLSKEDWSIDYVTWVFVKTKKPEVKK